MFVFKTSGLSMLSSAFVGVHGFLFSRNPAKLSTFFGRVKGACSLFSMHEGLPG